MKHYNREELDLYRNGDMNLFSRIMCSEHLKICVSCHKLLDSLKEDDALLEELRGKLNRLRHAAGDDTVKKKPLSGE